ncbi:MAG: hypothetical protein ACRDQ7_02115 [Haloechinothrix sp.]
MLQGLTLPDSWRTLLETFRPVFRWSSTFTLFSVRATGLVARTARRTVVGMLAGAGMAAVVSYLTTAHLSWASAPGSSGNAHAAADAEWRLRHHLLLFA